MTELTTIETQTHIAWAAYYDTIVKYRPKVKGRGQDPWSHKYKAEFGKIARYCIAQEIDVREYVKFAIIQKLNDGRVYITPKDIAKPALVAVAAAAFASDMEHDFEESWKYHMRSLTRTLRVRPGQYPTPEAVLMASINNFPAWFRVMAIVPFNEDTYAVHKNAAMEDLRDSKPLREFLREVVPDNLTEFERRSNANFDALQG